MKHHAWLVDLLAVSQLITLRGQIANGARWAGREARRAWHAVCRTAPARYVCQLAFAVVTLAVIWLTARQFRRQVNAEGRAELVNLALGVGLMLALFVLAWRSENDGPASDATA